MNAKQQEVFEELRSLIAECAPNASEVISRGSPAWQGNKLLAIISVAKTHLTLAFARGAEFTDGPGLLAGGGKTTRHLKFRDLTDLDRDAVREYVRQAVALDRS